MESLTTHSDAPSVTMSFGTGVAAVEAEAAGGVLAAGEARRGAGVLVDLVALGIDDPDVGAVGGDAFHRGIAGQRAGRPGAEQSAAGVVDVHLAVGVDDPGLVARDRAGRSARGGVAAVEAVRLDRRAAGVVLVGPILRGVVDDVELGRRRGDGLP